MKPSSPVLLAAAAGLGIGSLVAASAPALAGPMYQQFLAKRACFSQANRIVPTLQEMEERRGAIRSPFYRRLKARWRRDVARCEALPEGSNVSNS